MSSRLTNYIIAEFHEVVFLVAHKVMIVDNHAHSKSLLFGIERAYNLITVRENGEAYTRHGNKQGKASEKSDKH